MMMNGIFEEKKLMPLILTMVDAKHTSHDNDRKDQHNDNSYHNNYCYHDDTKAKVETVFIIVNLITS